MENAEGTRAYDASGRREQANRRRDDVIETAATVFGERGFEATTLAHIASAAGVSVAYLQGLGTKSELFRLALDRRATGGEGTLGGEGDDLVRAASSLPPDLALEMLVQATAKWNSGTHRLWRAWAQTSDGELSGEWDRSMVEVRSAYRQWLEKLDDIGARRPDVSIDEQAAGVWLLTMAETYDHLVRSAGLSHEQYLSWLARSLRELVLV